MEDPGIGELQRAIELSMDSTNLVPTTTFVKEQNLTNTNVKWITSQVSNKNNSNVKQVKRQHPISISGQKAEERIKIYNQKYKKLTKR